MKRALVVDVQDFINEHPFGRFRRLIFFMCFVIVLLDGFDTAAIGFIAPSLMTEWHLAKPDLAAVLSAALFGLAFGALVSGPLCDRVGRRFLMFGAVVLFGTASVASAFSTDLAQLTVLRFMTGIGLGAAMASAVTMMDEFCPTRRRATVTSLMCCGFPLGAACGGLIAAWLIPHAGWRSVSILGGVHRYFTASCCCSRCRSRCDSWSRITSP
jgi:AAHS family 4-hydroxybenzoate transporter-like MFS transporter